MDDLSIVSKVRLRLRAGLARRARSRNNEPDYRRNILAVFDIALAQSRAGPASESTIGSISDCEPVIDTQGGFFTCIAINASGQRFFTKCLRAEERESHFWRAWQRGQVRAEGKHYRLVPPIAMLHCGSVSILAFPELEFIAQHRLRHHEHSAQDLDRVVCAIADFNSDHMAPPAALVPVSRACDGGRAPSTSIVARTLGIDAERAQEVAATLRRIEAHWGEVRDRIYGVPHCLCHMDFHLGNVTVHEGVGYIYDFGKAGTAPPGADLYRLILSLAGPRDGWTGRSDLVARYTSVFSEKGIHLDAENARQALDGHFAARNRRVGARARRNPQVFEEAVRTSLELISANGGTGRSSDASRR